MTLFGDLHVGVSLWQERWVSRRSMRVKGIWDARLQREKLILKDGRVLTYFLDGPLLEAHRMPHIIVFHAMFLSGNAFIMNEPPTDYILVCVNRPGYFGSDRVATDFTYESFARDVDQLADHLDLNTYFVAGHSSGGPCALACAAHAPSRVRAIGILSGDPEYAHDDVPNKRRINAFCLGRFLPFLLKRVIPCLPLSRDAIDGLVNDYRLETRLYSFHTEDILQPALVFVGEDDNVLPLAVSRHVHERLANAELRVVPKAGHMGLLRDPILQEFFEALLSMPSIKEDKAKMHPVSHEKMIRRKSSDHAIS